jgi:hypothetical protein
MARLRYTGSSPVQLPTPFGYLVQPGAVVEVPDHLVQILKQSEQPAFYQISGDQGGTYVMPASSDWQDADQPVPEPEPAPGTPPPPPPPPVPEPEPEAPPAHGRTRSAG